MLKIYNFTLETLKYLKPISDEIARRDRDLANQMLRAMASIPLNIAEGTNGRGRNKPARYQTALGSAQETIACLDVAMVLGYIPTVAPSLEDRMDRIVRTLVKLSR